MPTTWVLLKGLSYTATAIASAGTGALVMYFSKPDVDLEPEKKKWSQEMDKLRGEIDLVNQEAQKITEGWQSELKSKQKSVNKVINAQLSTYDAQVKEYVDCLNKLFGKISHIAKNSWFSSLHYTKEERVAECREKPKLTKYSGTIE